MPISATNGVGPVPFLLIRGRITRIARRFMEWKKSPAFARPRSGKGVPSSNVGAPAIKNSHSPGPRKSPTRL